MVQVQTFGKYEIIRKLSRSMTDVYLAFDPELKRPVVLKMIERSGDDFTQLVIEAEKRGALIQKQLHELDSRILEIYDYGERDGCFFVAMQYFEGKTLAEILELEHRFEPKRAARYAAEVCSQLRRLHSFVSDVDGRKTAVVHGDVKPSNIQIGHGDELRLLDFGIAKVITFTHNLTHHNLGSPSYCSPERLSKAQVDRHADLWALGVTLYEMVSGAPPYQAQDTRKLENLIQSRRPPRALPETCPYGLKVIVNKALAADIEHRYQTAEAFENDLRAFLADRLTVASQERIPAWDANATIERHPPGPAQKTRSHGTAKKTLLRTAIVRTSIGNLAIALLAGILVGLLLFMPVGYYYRFSAAGASLRGPKDYAHESRQVLSSDWRLFQELRNRSQFLGQFSPANSLDKPLHANLMASAEKVIDSFRNSSDGRLSDFDWSKARQCLLYALQIDPANSKAKGELALCDGYINLMQNPKPPRAELSIGNFRQAESYLPRYADPHLGLARLYVYASHNVGQAVAELHQARQLGYRIGPKESVEEADGYLFRAELELARAKNTPPSAQPDKARLLQLARADFARARNLYEPIVGFSNVSESLDKLYQDQNEEDQLEVQQTSLNTAKTHNAKRRASSRRWR